MGQSKTSKWNSRLCFQSYLKSTRKANRKNKCKNR